MLFLERKKYRTPMQKKVKELFAKGYRAEEIAKELNISISTVYLHSCNANKREKGAA